MHDREAFYEQARAYTPGVVVEHDGLATLVHTGDLWISRSMFVWGHWGYDEMAAVVDFADRHVGHPIVKGRCMVDVGANIGTSALMAISRFGADHVIAIEPHRRNARMLRANVVLNGLEDRVTVIEAAASDRDGRLLLSVSDDNQGDHRTVDPSDPDARGYPVQAGRLDRLVPRRRDVGLLWVDTQGHDARVIAGGSRLVRRVDACVIEYWPMGIREPVERFHDQVASMWPRFVDVADLVAGDGRLRSTDRLVELVDRYPDDGPHTDLLLVR